MLQYTWKIVTVGDIAPLAITHKESHILALEIRGGQKLIGKKLIAINCNQLIDCKVLQLKLIDCKVLQLKLIDCIKCNYCN